jgi:hypothetical protein
MLRTACACSSCSYVVTISQRSALCPLIAVSIMILDLLDRVLIEAQARLG